MAERANFRPIAVTRAPAVPAAMPTRLGSPRDRIATRSRASFPTHSVAESPLLAALSAHASRLAGRALLRHDIGYDNDVGVELPYRRLPRPAGPAERENVRRLTWPRAAAMPTPIHRTPNSLNPELGSDHFDAISYAALPDAAIAFATPPFEHAADSIASDAQEAHLQPAAEQSPEPAASNSDAVISRIAASPSSASVEHRRAIAPERYIRSLPIAGFGRLTATMPLTIGMPDADTAASTNSELSERASVGTEGLLRSFTDVASESREVGHHRRVGAILQRVDRASAPLDLPLARFVAPAAPLAERAEREPLARWVRPTESVRAQAGTPVWSMPAQRVPVSARPLGATDDADRASETGFTSPLDWQRGASASEREVFEASIGPATTSTRVYPTMPLTLRVSRSDVGAIPHADAPFPGPSIPSAGRHYDALDLVMRQPMSFAGSLQESIERLTLPLSTARRYASLPVDSMRSDAAPRPDIIGSATAGDRLAISDSAASPILASSGRHIGEERPRNWARGRRDVPPSPDSDRPFIAEIGRIARSMPVAIGVPDLAAATSAAQASQFPRRQSGHVTSERTMPLSLDLYRGQALVEPRISAQTMLRWPAGLIEPAATPVGSPLHAVPTGDPSIGIAEAPRASDPLALFAEGFGGTTPLSPSAAGILRTLAERFAGMSIASPHMPHALDLPDPASEQGSVMESEHRAGHAFPPPFASDVMARRGTRMAAGDESTVSPAEMTFARRATPSGDAEVGGATPLGRIAYGRQVARTIDPFEFALFTPRGRAAMGQFPAMGVRWPASVSAAGQSLDEPRGEREPRPSIWRRWAASDGPDPSAPVSHHGEIGALRTPVPAPPPSSALISDFGTSAVGSNFLASLPTDQPRKVREFQQDPFRTDEFPVTPYQYPNIGQVLIDPLALASPQLGQAPVARAVIASAFTTVPPLTATQPAAPTVMPESGFSDFDDITTFRPAVPRTLAGISSATWGRLARFVDRIDESASDPWGAMLAGSSGAGLPLATPRTATETAQPSRPSARPMEPMPAMARAAHIPVFRSAFADRADPSAEQQSTAARYMAESTGDPLPATLRRSLEHAIGADFGAVRVHSGPSISRAADMLSARAMTRGTDVYMPSAVGEHSDAATTSLLAHELSHVADHIGGRPAMPMAPMNLAQRHSADESRAEHVERTIARQIEQPAERSQSAPVELTLARAPAPTQMVVQRVETETAMAAPAPGTPAAPGAAPAGGASSAADAAKIAEQVYAMLERRLLIERERGGFRR